MNNIVKHADIFSAPASVIPTIATSGGYAVISTKGSKWRIKHKSEETLIRDEEGDPKSTIDLVIIDAPSHVSKTYYKSGYVEGTADAPDCQSINGMTPDPASTDPQAPSCAACPHNQFGSRITPSGGKGKACSDSLRLAVVPAGDILNENFGGAMLLRVSATAMSGFDQYNKLLKANGKSFRAVITRVSFDPEASYPKMIFKKGRDLSEDEREAVVEMYSRTDALSRILSEPAQPREDDDAQPAPTPAPAKRVAKPAPAKAEKPAPAPKAEPAKAAEPEAADALSDELDELLAGLDLE